MRKIRNRDQLLQKGDHEAREKVVNMLEGVLQAMDARVRIRALMRLEGDLLTVGNKSWDLSQKKNVYLFGAGKACNAMAEAVCDILGERLTRGIISVKIAEPQDRYVRTEVYVGGHPLPNAQSVAAAEAMLEMIEEADPADLFISVFSGGSSALLACPVDGISLEDEILTHDVLLKSGARILEINAVRRHISRTNGGWMAERLHRRGAELISLMIGDAVGAGPTEDRASPAVFFGTMVAPDGTSIRDARDVLVNYNLSQHLPESVTSFLLDDARVRETPKLHRECVTTFLLDNVADSCDEAQHIADGMGIPLLVFSTFLEGESREAGLVLASLAREIQGNHRPIAPPCYVVASGETTTTLSAPASGNGGPSQELVLGFGLGIKDSSGIALASIDTEGTDGTTYYAGGIADTKTFERLTCNGVNIYEALRNHATGNALESIGDNIMTGNTGTNVCDFNVIYITQENSRRA